MFRPQARGRHAEDFVQGYRPTASGAFVLKEGIFMRFRNAACADPDDDYVLIIDEINRGNLSKIFGELMLLIEHDKRNSHWATRLSYSEQTDPLFYVPENLYLIGMMNTADRSLAHFDYAFRRRFVFITLDPAFNSPAFRTTLQSASVPDDLIAQIIARMNLLNEAIASDVTNLGRGFQIGHSFFVPSEANGYFNGWYEQIIETEIRPLLENYWFDDPNKCANLFCYAWARLPKGDMADVGIDNCPDLPNLFARILINGIHRLLRRGFKHGYLVNELETRSPRGRINLARSIKEQTTIRGALVCQFDELRRDVIENRILKATTRELSRTQNIDPALAHELRGH
jgi:hypothetical protein